MPFRENLLARRSSFQIVGRNAKRRVLTRVAVLERNATAVHIQHVVACFIPNRRDLHHPRLLIASVRDRARVASSRIGSLERLINHFVHLQAPVRFMQLVGAVELGLKLNLDLFPSGAVATTTKKGYLPPGGTYQIWVSFTELVAATFPCASGSEGAIGTYPAATVPRLTAAPATYTDPGPKRYAV